MLRVLFTLVSLAAILTVYVKWVRPTLAGLPHLSGLYAEANGFWAKVLAWLRVKWDMVLAGAMVVGPMIPDILTQFQMVDLSNWVATETAKTVMALIGISQIVMRAFVLRQTTDIPPPPPVE